MARLRSALALAALAACARAPEPAAAPAPVRGVILISIDALRADALGVYGSARPTTPFLDRLARERAIVFERAFSPIPSTLPAHLSMFTGLYPSEHGVAPPSDVLAASIPTLPEQLRAAGVRTFGHSEGGYVQGGYGFARGFEEWSDTAYAADTDVERTFRRGLDSLARVEPGERFFLFLHSYTVHDPYAPPAGYAERFWRAPPAAGAPAPTGPNLAAANRGELAVPAGAEAWYRALYDAGVAYLDDRLAAFFAELDRRGLAGETTVVFTADHGEEMREHGRFAHTQIYPECLRVPLVVVPPAGAAPRRVRELVSLVDYAPTVLELLGVAAPAASGRSLVPLLGAGGAGGDAGHRVFAQDEGTEVRGRAVIAGDGTALHQLVRWSVAAESDGFWMPRRFVFDALPPALELRAVAFGRPRRVALRAGGRELPPLVVGTEWASHRRELPAGAKVAVVLESADCERPSASGAGADQRCLSVKLAGTPLDRVELYDLAADPLAGADLSAREPALVRRLAGELKAYPETALAPATRQELDPEQVRQLKALGYL